MQSRTFIFQRLTGVVAFTALLFSFSCCKHHENSNTQVNPNDYKDNLVEVNKELNKNEDESIESYIKRHGWEMINTGTGLRYLIYEEGAGEKAEKDKLAVLNYSVSLLDGTEVYNSKDLGQKKFVIGTGGVESGLEEAVLLLRVGDKAKLILPSHLAYGLMGDDNKIPSRAALVYDVELTALRDI